MQRDRHVCFALKLLEVNWLTLGQNVYPQVRSSLLRIVALLFGITTALKSTNQSTYFVVPPHCLL
jgi:hypothetical protein